MLFVVITHPEQLQNLPYPFDGIELRLDLFPDIDWDFLKQLVDAKRHFLIFTLRKKSQGGGFQDSEENREALIEKLLALQPCYFDLESEMRSSFLHKVLNSYPRTKFILSYHNFENTPSDLEKIYRVMSSFPAFVYKIATLAVTTNDALRLILFSKKNPQISGIPMGEKGTFARILGPVCSNLLNYASLENTLPIAPGQLTTNELSMIYRFQHLTPHTKLYGLIGDPVSNSQGHFYHNRVFEKRNLDAVYVKMQVEADELKSFFPLAKELGFRGLSVTMPLKEQVLEFLDQMEPKAQQMQAVNTILFRSDGLLGTNTDGTGALNALEKRGAVFGKEIVIIGSGGAARSIAFEAHERGARISIVNRSIEKARQLATLLDCQALPIDNLPLTYDILINCTPSPMPIDPQSILPSALVMDVVYNPKETPFLLEAKKRGCSVIYGEEMFQNQAEAQANLWS